MIRQPSSPVKTRVPIVTEPRPTAGRVGRDLPAGRDLPPVELVETSGARSCFGVGESTDEVSTGSTAGAQPRAHHPAAMDFSDLITQVMTAMVTLIGVVITLVINGRREAKRTEQLLAFERAKILADDRRKVFVATVHFLQRMRELLKAGEVRIEQDREEAWAHAVTERADDLFMLETELRLLAPELAREVRSATQIARRYRDETDPRAGRSGLLEDYTATVRRTMSTMRALLGTT